MGRTSFSGRFTRVEMTMPEEIQRDLDDYLASVRRALLEQSGCMKPIALDVSASHELSENVINMSVKIRYTVLPPPEPDATVTGGSP